MNLAEFPLTVLPVLLFPDDELLLLLLKIVFPNLFVSCTFISSAVSVSSLSSEKSCRIREKICLYYGIFVSFSYLPAAVALKDCLQLHQQPFFSGFCGFTGTSVFFILPPFPLIYQVHLVSPSYPDLPFPVSYGIYTGRSI